MDTIIHITREFLPGRQGNMACVSFIDKRVSSTKSFSFSIFSQVNVFFNPRIFFLLCIYSHSNKI